MKVHIITVGAPKLDYAVAGWQLYLQRLQHYHQVRVTHVADKNNDSRHLLLAANSGPSNYLVALTIDGPQLTSEGLADFLDKRAQEAREVCFIIGGPDGLPADVMAESNYQLGLSQLTFPHDLAMVILAEALYRASTINDGLPYHR